MTDFQVDDVLQADLSRVAGRRIFFGHQSVGRNIVDGLADLKALAGVDRLNILPYQPGDALPSAFFAECNVGSNQHPQSKFEAFARLLNTELAGRVHIALVKICYVDIAAGTDVDAVLRGYLEAVHDLEAAQPGLKIVPVTCPLRARASGAGLSAVIKRTIKSVLKARDDNSRRSQFNEGLREACRGRLLFDLAAAESTYPDGRRECYGDGARIEALIPAYTSDGGHLNELGRKRAARELIRVLARA